MVEMPGGYEAYCFDKLPDPCKALFMDYVMNAPSHNLVGASDFVREGGLETSILCESPIEVILDFVLNIYYFEMRRKGKHFPIVHNQYEIEAENKTYFADFYIDSDITEDSYVGKNRLKLVVECDGHEFHEKTVEQVNRDNERDYYLNMAGCDVLHFSGSEIYNAPIPCGQKIYRYIQSKVGEWILKEETEESVNDGD